MYIFLYEKAASKATSAEPPPRWAIGTGQLSCLQFRSGPIARRGGGGIMPFLFFVVSAGPHDRYRVFRRHGLYRSQALVDNAKNTPLTAFSQNRLKKDLKIERPKIQGVITDMITPPALALAVVFFLHHPMSWKIITKKCEK